MAEVIEMVQLSPTMEEGVLVAWLKKVGDAVETGELIAEVETDKATMEMESWFDGTLLAILVEAGQAAPVGTPLAIVGEPGEDIEALKKSLAEKASSKSAAGDTNDGEPEPSEPADEGGSAADTEETPEADSGEPAGGDASAEAPAPSAPSKSPRAARPATQRAGANARRAPGERVLASPLARRIAEERGIDIANVPGSGPGGRVVRRDVEEFTPAASGGGSLFSRGAAQDRTEPLSQMRKAVARTTTAAWKAPAFMLTRQIAMDRLMATRAELNDALAEQDAGVKLSVNDFIIRACALALMDVPAMNSAYEDGAITLFGSADVGMAVAIDGGLITPVIRDAQALSVVDIAQAARELAGKARDKKLKPEEYTGATFSVSNLGMFGIDHFTAVLNPPAAGILAVGATQKVPVVLEDGSLGVGQRMSVTLTCDHRAVDGAVGATFLQRFARYMEAPAVLVA
jgi:pyruvate dehydrogenase E2 component (dihydrolipoamide acetyltransferase)